MKSTQEHITEVSQLQSELASAMENNEQLSDELSKSNERFILAMKGANEGVWDWDLKSDTVYYSPRWKSMLGYEEHELEGTLDTWRGLVHPEEQSAILEEAQNYLSGVSSSFEVEMRMRHKQGHFIYVRSSGFRVLDVAKEEVVRLIGYHTDISPQKEAELFKRKNNRIMEMIAKGVPAPDIYDEIALMYESRHPGMRCSMLELDGDILLHGGAPSMPEVYCKAVNGLKIGPEIGSCGTSTYTGERVLVEDIATDPKWADLKDFALPHGMRSCWSEPIKSSSGEVLGAFGMYYDYPALPDKDESEDLAAAAVLAGIVMERDHNQKRIRHLAFRDDLTGFSSRSHLYIKLEELISESKASNDSFGLLYLDLDNFKGINDSLGHDAGDRHLQDIASRLRLVDPHAYTLARLGGDEFCILVRGIDKQRADTIAEDYLAAISKPSDVSGRKVIQTCSIGIAFYPEDGKDLQALLKAADTALYTAKERGKNQYAFYDRALTEAAEYRFRVEQYLREAIENRELSLVYQPQIDLISGKVVGAEALSRWNHPALGQISPVEFIEIAERIGMIKPLTEQVLKRVCHQIAAWAKEGLGDLRVSVNVSANHFTDPDFVPLIEKVLKQSGVSPSSLELEVTETVVQTRKNYLRVFHALKNMGVPMAIDDFGTGYSSFASLKHLSLDCLKIDKYFLDDYTDKKTELLIGSMIKMAHSLGYKVVAEGVEQSAQAELLKKLGCDLVQGYLFSKPISENELNARLASQP